MRRRLMQVVLGIGVSGGLLLLTPQVAYADNCGDFTDCFGTTGAAVVAAVAVAAVVAAVVFGFGLLAVGELLADAAAEGLAAEAEAAAAEAAAAAAEAAEAEAAAAEAEEAMTEAQSAVESAEANPDKVSHIFDQAKHNWDMTGLDQQGNWNLIQNTLQNNYGQLPSDGVYQVTQNFGNYTVTVRGAVVNSAVRIGSAWVNAI